MIKKQIKWDPEGGNMYGYQGAVVYIFDPTKTGKLTYLEKNRYGQILRQTFGNDPKDDEISFGNEEGDHPHIMVYKPRCGISEETKIDSEEWDYLGDRKSMRGLVKFLMEFCEEIINPLSGLIKKLNPLSP